VRSIDANRFGRANSTVNLVAASASQGDRDHNQKDGTGRAGREHAHRGEITVKFRVELVWQDSDANAASSIYLTSDGRVILQGRAVSSQERQALALPADGEMISVDRNLIHAIKDML
jgi:hypothetical protein